MKNGNKKYDLSTKYYYGPQSCRRRVKVNPFPPG